jgi:hypothetical protein
LNIWGYCFLLLLGDLEEIYFFHLIPLFGDVLAVADLGIQIYLYKILIDFAINLAL